MFQVAFDNNRKLEAIGNVTIPTPTSGLSLYNTSNVETLANNVTVGEVLTFRVSLTLPLGTTSRPIIYLAASTGLSFTNTAIITPANIEYGRYTSKLSNSDQEDTFNDLATINFDSLVNTPPSVSNVIAIEVTAVVIPLYTNVNGTELTVTADFVHSNVSSATITQSAGAVTVIVRQAALSWTVKNNATSGNAGDIVQYRVEITHATNSTAPAYNLDLHATLAPYFNLINSSVVSTDPAARFGQASSPSGTGIMNLPVLGLGKTVNTTFSVIIDSSAKVSTSLSRLIGLDYASSPSAGVNSYPKIYTHILNSPHHFFFSFTLHISLASVMSMSILAAVKSDLAVISSSNDETKGASVSIGEYVDFGVTVTLPRGTTDSLAILFKLPTSQGLLSIVNVSVPNQPANIEIPSMSVDLTGFNDTASLNIPSIINNPGFTSNITFAFTALVHVSSRNTNGLQLVATSVLSYSNGTSQFPEATRSTTITVVAPSLSISATYDASSGDAGDIIGCSVTIFHAAGSSGAAYAINLNGLVSSYLHLVSGSVTSNVTTSASPSGVDSIAYLPVLAVGSSALIRFNIVLDNTVAASSIIKSQLFANYSSSPVGGYNTYPKLIYLLKVKKKNIANLILNLNRSASSSYDISISPAPVTSLVLLNTSIPSANAIIVNVGEIATFALTLTIPEGITNGVSISIFASAPSGAFAIKSVSFVGPSNIVANSLSVQLADENGDGSDDTALVTATSLVNTVKYIFINDMS